MVFDAHLMIENPDQYIKEFVDAGCDIIVVHQEACRHLHRTIQNIKSYGIKAGVSLNPATPIETIKHIIRDVDMVLIMTVNPGFGGQSFIESIYDYIICSDGGANHAYSMNIVPDYIIGDLDSVNENIIEYYKSKKVKFEKFPTKKDETDTELCIELSDKLKAKEIHLIGALGGRIDHTIANINLLYYIRKRGITPKIISEKEEIYIAMDEEITIYGEIGDIISILPIKNDAKGVTLNNLEYPLEDYDIEFSRPLGISNVMTDVNCSIKVKEGSLIIIKNI